MVTRRWPKVYSANAFNLVRNIYKANCGNQNKWHIYSGSNVAINHGSNTNTVTAVTQPTATGCKSSYLNVVNKNIPLDYPNHCPVSPPSSGGTTTITSNRLASMNNYVTILSNQRAADIAVGKIPDDFELQSTVVSKLNLYLTDSALTNAEEVVTILEQNQGYMEDADIQTVFAYMHKGNFGEATTKTNQLGSNRADWKTLLTQVIAFQKDTVNGMGNISQQYIDFFSGYAASTDKDGKALAQALLMAASVSEYNEPHALPEGSYSGRMANQHFNEGELENGDKNYKIDVFPNPTKTGISISYAAHEEGSVKIEMKDLLGKIIYTNFIDTGSPTHWIEMEHFNKGMYLVTLIRGREIIYSKKIIRE